MAYSTCNNPANANNFTVGRQGARVNKIVIHHAATTDFDGIGRTFQAPNRQASAHYGVGRNNNVDKYVDESNTAWHCGNWQGNLTSVGIENVNSSGAPDWGIAPETFNTLVELVRDIAKRHGLLPLKAGVNLLGHRDFSATACPGQLYGRLQELADRVNNGTSPSPQPAPAKKTNAQVAQEVLQGKWGNGEERKQRLAAAGYDYNAVQAIVNGGYAPAAPARKTDDTIAREVIAGSWGNGDARRANLERAGYNYANVQARVNAILAGSAKPAGKSIETIADEVIRGEWGNGDDRKARLRNAGYDYNAVQSVVNRKLS